MVAETGTEERNNSRTATQPSDPVIRLVPPRADEEYLRALTGNAERDYSAYLELRPKYIHTPAFYFHVADHFYRLGDRERALRVLTSVAEIDLENASLFRLLGYRLEEYGERHLALHVTRQVTRWRPDEPQGYRDHALALASAGRQQEALDSLLALLTREYPLNVHARAVGGIDEVVVTEINRLLAKNALDASGVDARLVQPLPVDIRVVLN